MASTGALRGEPLDLVDELVLHGGLELAAGLLDRRAVLELDERLFDVGVDAAEHARQQIVAEQHGLGGHRLAVVVALMKPHHRLGHRAEQPLAAHRLVGDRHVVCSLALRIGAHAGQKDENRTSSKRP